MWSVLRGELAIVALAPSVAMKLIISYMCFAIAQQQRKFGRVVPFDQQYRDNERALASGVLQD
ncbi:hypothetical protein J1N35_043013 [Gossypium stocksii]|uniref:Uncharacterized protein n=1 Tax=Gossypium stocksii TaxID=47602 RepID=A0A9D3U6I9_9ROSI|nr:hypothetical protein J1N35_043013 [Gossypium stocksii]